MAPNYLIAFTAIFEQVLTTYGSLSINVRARRILYIHCVENRQKKKLRVYQPGYYVTPYPCEKYNVFLMESNCY